MRNHGQPVRVIPRVWLSMPNWVLKPDRLIIGEKDVDVDEPDVLEKGGEEDEEVVPGQRFTHADSPAKTKRDKLILLHKAPPPLKLLKKPMRPAKGKYKKGT